jgi:hypothetical protein
MGVDAMLYASKESMICNFLTGAAKKDLIICQQKGMFLGASAKGN